MKKARVLLGSMMIAAAVALAACGNEADGVKVKTDVKVETNVKVKTSTKDIGSKNIQKLKDYKGTLIGSVEISGDDYIELIYTSFNGERGYAFKVSQSDEYEIHFEITTKDGVLNLILEKEDGSTEYRGQELSTCDFTVGVPDKDTYYLVMTGENHEGSVKATLRKKEQ